MRSPPLFHAQNKQKKGKNERKTHDYFSRITDRYREHTVDKVVSVGGIDIAKAILLSGVSSIGKILWCGRLVAADHALGAALTAMGVLFSKLNRSKQSSFIQQTVRCE